MNFIPGKNVRPARLYISPRGLTLSFCSAQGNCRWQDSENYSESISAMGRCINQPGSTISAKYAPHEREAVRKYNWMKEIRWHPVCRPHPQPFNACQRFRRILLYAYSVFPILLIFLCALYAPHSAFYLIPRLITLIKANILMRRTSGLFNEWNASESIHEIKIVYRNARDDEVSVL